MIYILCAAILYKDGCEHPHQPKNIDKGYVLCGRRHHNCIANGSIFGVRLADFEHTQGFITNDDRFVDRFEAAQIAFSAGQISKNTDMLFSEDLY